MARAALHSLWLPVVVGAIWRFGILVVDKWHQPLLLNDSLYYSAQARQLVDGRLFREIFVDQPGAEHGPLTSTLMAAVSWLPHPIGWQRALTVVCGVATIAVIGLLGRSVGGRRAGLIAAWVAAAYPNLWMNDGLVMSESVSVLVVSAILLIAHRALSATTLAAPAPRAAAWLGALVGLGILARSELVVFVAPLAVLLWLAAPSDAGGRSRAWLAPAVMTGMTVAVLAPWVAFNLVRFERPVTLTTNDGTTLLGAYCDDAFFGDTMGGWTITCVVADPEYLPDEEPSVRSARQRSLALDYAADHLDDLPRVMSARVLRTLDLYGIDDQIAQDVGEERYRWASWAGIVSWWVLAPVAMAGMFRLPTRTRWLLLVPCSSVLVTTVLFYGAHRIRSTLEPVVVVCAAVAIAAVVRGRVLERADDDVTLVST